MVERIQRELAGNLRFFFRNFPFVDAHESAMHSARLAEAAAVSGKFWEAHDQLYENQDALGIDNLFRYGVQLGLDTALLDQAFQGRFDETIRADFLGGVRSGVIGTPRLFLSGVRYDGSRDVETLVYMLGRLARSRD